MRIILPLILIGLAVIWELYTFFIAKDMKLSKTIAGFILFFVSVWTILYYFIFR